MQTNPRILVAGASGYIGKAIIPQLLARFPKAEIVALSRTQHASDDPRVVWKACDLFSSQSLSEAIPPRVDLAIYLVHSMGPTAQLDQGSFADYDLLLAYNFASAIKNVGVSHVLYLGGLIPENTPLSLHLQSRLEVEEAFAEFGLPCTFFRAGLILGAGGSSFQILLKLVSRLPLMICPHWTQTMTTPVDLQTVLEALTQVALDPIHIGKTYDLAGCRPITYLQMMRATARQLGRRPLFIKVPFFTPTLSRLWVSLVTNTPKDLVYPLVESLQHPMVARESHLFSKVSQTREYVDLLKLTSLDKDTRSPLFNFRPQRKTVRSVQRLPLPAGKTAVWVKDRYIEWIPQFLNPLIKVATVENRIQFSVLLPRWVMLELRVDPDQSSCDIQRLSIVKGLLVAEHDRGRLEFLVVLNRRFVVAAIHDYRPSLPWFIYRYTQAQLHLLVMRAFARELGSTMKA